MRRVNHETITGALSLFKILPFNRLHKRRKRVYESFSTRRKNPKLFFRTIFWNLENPVKIYHGITELQHLIDPRQIASLREPFDEKKKVLEEYCCNQDWMKDGGPILWNAIAVCEMSKTSWQKGKLFMKDDLQNHQRANNSFRSNG